jgi:hypothetical protein
MRKRVFKRIVAKKMFSEKPAGAFGGISLRLYRFTRLA